MPTTLIQEKKTFPKIDLLSFGAALCIATLPWSLKLNALIIIGFSISVPIYMILNKIEITIRPKSFLVGSIIFLVALLWLLNTRDQQTGLKYIERSLSALIFPFIFSLVYNRFTLNKRIILRLFLISCALRYFLFLNEVIEFELMFIFDYWKEVLIQFNQLFKVHALHPSYFSMYLGFCSLICYDMVFKAQNKIDKSLWIIGVLLFFIFNLSLAAKMPIVATILSILLVNPFFVLKRASKKQKALVTFIIVVGTIFLGLFLYKVPNPISQDLNNYYQLLKGEEIEDIYDYNQYGTNSSLATWEKTNRVHIWKSGIAVFQENWLFGVGTGDIASVLNQRFILSDQKYLAIKDTNSHNQMLDYLIKYGIIGFIVIAIAFIMYFTKAWKENNQLFFMFLTLCCLCMLTENILNRQYGIVFFFYLNSLFYFYRPIPKRGRIRFKNKRLN